LRRGTAPGSRAKALPYVPPVPRIFVLSPASAGGERARLLLRPEASFPLALALRSAAGAPLGDVFAFLSGLYFRGKLAYARAFGAPPRGVAPGLVVTAGGDLWTPETPITARQLARWARLEIDERDARYRRAFRRSARDLASRAADAEIVLLGSIATGKYAEVLLDVFGDRLAFPIAFVGRGDMSRGGLMLRAVRAGEELEYVPLAGAVRKGKRPARLPKIRPDA
jgi:hypothetical protein